MNEGYGALPRPWVCCFDFCRGLHCVAPRIGVRPALSILAFLAFDLFIQRSCYSVLVQKRETKRTNNQERNETGEQKSKTQEKEKQEKQEKQEEQEAQDKPAKKEEPNGNNRKQ